MIRRFWRRLVAALIVEVAADDSAGVSRLDVLDGVGVPFMVHTRAGERGVVAESLADALRWQESLHGRVTQGGRTVVEAIA